jgi:hypothetical protein
MSQNLRVWSPAPVTILVLHGLNPSYNTLHVCPVKQAIFYKVGYFHTIISLS